MPPKPEQEPIALDSLNVQELAQLRERLNSDVQNISEGVGQLQGVLMKFASTNKAVGMLKNSNAGQQILLPLTSSMYVPGEIASTETVLVELGTGYFVEMTPDKGIKYCERRSRQLEGQIAMVTTNLRQKQGMLMQTQEILSQKLQAQGATQ